MLNIFYVTVFDVSSRFIYKISVYTFRIHYRAVVCGIPVFVVACEKKQIALEVVICKCRHFLPYRTRFPLAISYFWSFLLPIPPFFSKKLSGKAILSFEEASHSSHCFYSQCNKSFSCFFAILSKFSKKPNKKANRTKKYVTFLMIFVGFQNLLNVAKSS